jgi:hypothetical protein
MDQIPAVEVVLFAAASRAWASLAAQIGTAEAVGDLRCQVVGYGASFGDKFLGIEDPEAEGMKTIDGCNQHFLISEHLLTMVGSRRGVVGRTIEED